MISNLWKLNIFDGDKKLRIRTQRDLERECVVVRNVIYFKLESHIDNIIRFNIFSRFNWSIFY